MDLEAGEGSPKSAHKFENEDPNIKEVNEYQSATDTPTIWPSQSQASSNDSNDDPNPPRNPRLKVLAAKQADLEGVLASLQAQRTDLVNNATKSRNEARTDDETKAALASANAVIQSHISRLQRYNEIKDVGQGLMGLIAEMKGKQMGAVMEDFGMSEDD